MLETEKNNPRKEETWPKQCKCGEHFTEEQWEKLSYIGLQRSVFDDYPDLELRNCRRCGSTMAITVPMDFV